jgi:hypothetical protein
MGRQLIKVDFPAIKDWEITAFQKVINPIFESDSRVELYFKDFDINFQTDLTLDERGFLDPTVYDV